MKRLALAVALLPAAAAAAPYRQPVNAAVVVSAYVDHGGVTDWNCGGNTYGGHQGTDIAIIGGFAAMDQGREIVAAADGTVIEAHDGEFDRCTTGDCAGGGGFGNHVYLQHDDGQVTIYGHMRTGSVAVGQGQRVSCGQHLGLVGSSGHSTGPHCHFQVNVNGQHDDPFAGPCGGPLDYWRDQGGYNGLPGADCGAPPPPPPPPPKPDLQLDFRLEAAAPQACDFADCNDFIRDGASGGVFDAWAGQEVLVRIIVANAGNGPTNAESDGDSAVTLDYTLPGALVPESYLIESDWPAKDRATWAPNDAMGNPANPPAAAPPATGSLRLNAFSPGESKRVTIVARAAGRSIDLGGHAQVQAWMLHVGGYYGEKTGWDDGVETNDGQSYNGGDLKVGGQLDTFDPTAFLFDAPDEGQIEGWRSCAPDAVGPLALDLGEHSLAVPVTGTGPCVESPRVAVPAAGWPGVELTVRESQGPRRGRLQWTTEALPAFGDDREVPFALEGDGTFEPVWLAPDWIGTLTRIRVMADIGAEAGDSGFDVGEVKLTADPPPPAPPPGKDAGAPGTPQGPDGPGPSGDAEDGRVFGDGGLLPGVDGGGDGGDRNAAEIVSRGGCSFSARATGAWPLLLLGPPLLLRRRRPR